MSTSVDRRFWRSNWYSITAPIWLWPLGWWCSYHSWSVLSWFGNILLITYLVYLMMALLAVLGLIIFPVLSLIPKFRSSARIATIQSIVMILSFFVGMFTGQSVWRIQVEGVAARGDVVVAAIIAYESKYLQPPQTLDALIPEFLPATPSTGVGCDPEFQYHRNQQSSYDGNPWVLVFVPPCIPMGFDTMMYFPLQNYPKRGYGGGIERIGAWGYVHE